MIYHVILRALMKALMSEAIQLRLLSLIESAVGKQNDDQLARIRADLSSMEGRLSARIDGIEARVSQLEAQGARRRATDFDVPGPPPPLPGGEK